MQAAVSGTNKGSLMGAQGLRTGKGSVSEGDEREFLRRYGVHMYGNLGLLLGFPKNSVCVQQRLDSGLGHLGLDLTKLCPAVKQPGSALP